MGIFDHLSSKRVEDIVEDLRKRHPSRPICYVVLFGDRPLTAKMGGDESILAFTSSEKATTFIKGYQQYYLTTKPLSRLPLSSIEELWAMLNNKAWDTLYKPPYGLIIDFSYTQEPPTISYVYPIEQLQRIGCDGLEKGVHTLFSILRPTIEKMLQKKDVRGLIKALGDKDYNVRYEAASAFAEMGEIAVMPLIEALKDEGGYRGAYAAEALRNIGSEAVRPLIQALENKDGIVREKAAELLGNIGDARAIEPLTQALRDQVQRVRWAAEDGLKKIKEN